MLIEGCSAPKTPHRSSALQQPKVHEGRWAFPFTPMDHFESLFTSLSPYEVAEPLGLNHKCSLCYLYIRH